MRVGGWWQSACTGGYMRVQAVRPMSLAAGGRVFWNLEYPLGLSQTWICADFSEIILAQKINKNNNNKKVELHSFFWTSRPKVAQIGPDGELNIDCQFTKKAGNWRNLSAPLYQLTDGCVTGRTIESYSADLFKHVFYWLPTKPESTAANRYT